MARPNLFQDTREHILATGETLIRNRGFTAAGLTELLSVANVPKGSFYHYFKSKEDYGVALLIRYFDQYDASMGDRLTAPGGSAREVDIAGGLVTHGRGIDPMELHGSIETLRIVGGLAAASGGFDKI